MSKTFTKRALSLLIALALTLSLVPAFAYAAEGEETTAEDIVLEFNKNTITDKDGADDAVANEGQNFGIVNTDNKTTAASFEVYDDFVRIDAYTDSGNYDKAWYNYNPSQENRKSRGKFTVSTSNVPAGVYEVKVKGYLIQTGCMMFVYVDDQYMGIYDCYNANIKPGSSNPKFGNAGEGEEVSLGYISIEPEEGAETKTVEIQFLNAGNSTGTGDGKGSNMLISSVDLHPVDAAPSVVGIECDIPNSVKPGDSFTITPKVKLSDGSYKAVNGILNSNAADANNNISAAVSWNSDNLTEEVLWNPTSSAAMYETNGSYAATFTAPAEAAGTEADVKVTAVVDGVTYVYKKTVWVLDENSDPESFKLQVVGNTERGTNGDGKTLDNTWTTNGYSIILDKSPTYSSAGNTTDQTISGVKKRIVQYRTRSTSKECWPLRTESTNNVITLEKNVPVAGWYKITADGYTDKAYGALFSIYVNGEYAGDYNFYGGSEATGYSAGGEKSLNTLELPAGNVEIAFYARKAGEHATYPAMYLDNITFTKTTAPTITEVKTTGMTSEMAVGATADCTAQAVMSDGTRNFGYTVDGTLPTKDVIKVESTDDSVVAVSNVVCVEENVATDAEQTIDPTTTTYTLTAKKPGKATITVTALVDGVGEKTTTQTIEVPYADADAEDIKNTISYIVRAEDSANNSKISVSDTAYEGIGKVGEWTVGESFTATAMGDGFAYWTNGNGAPVSTEASYTFKPTSNFTLEAVYISEESETKKVQFWNYNKVFLDEVTAEGETLGDKMPSNPSLNGYTFSKWVADGIGVFNKDTTLKDAITRVVAQFTKNDPSFSVGTKTLAYDETYSDTATDEKDSVAFSYWTIDDQVASYNKTLSFNVWDTVEVEAVYEGTKTAVPTVVLDKVSNEEYFIHYEVPTGYTAVDAGIVFGTSNKVTVDSTDGSKASVKKAGAKGQFTAAPHKDAAANTVARGYVMYRDSYNNLRVLYTEVK